MMYRLKKFFGSNEGVTAIEYGLIAALVSIVIILAVTALGHNVAGLFGTVANEVKKVSNSAGAIGDAGSGSGTGSGSGSEPGSGTGSGTGSGAGSG